MDGGVAPHAAGLSCCSSLNAMHHVHGSFQCSLLEIYSLQARNKHCQTIFLQLCAAQQTNRHSQMSVVMTQQKALDHRCSPLITNHHGLWNTGCDQTQQEALSYFVASHCMIHSRGVHLALGYTAQCVSLRPTAHLLSSLSASGCVCGYAMDRCIHPTSRPDLLISSFFPPNIASRQPGSQKNPSGCAHSRTQSPS